MLIALTSSVAGQGSAITTSSTISSSTAMMSLTTFFPLDLDLEFKKLLMGASFTSFLMTNGLNVLEKSDRTSEGPAFAFMALKTVGFAIGAFLEKKLAMIERDLFSASFSFCSFSVFANFLSCLSFSYRAMGY